jgi:hypothetical protein
MGRKTMGENISFYSKTFYKYRPLNEFTRQIFIQGTFWFSSPPKLNDPLDMRIPLDWKCNDEEVLDFLLSKYHSGIDSSAICERIVQFQNSFSRTPSDEETMALCVRDKGLRLMALVLRAQQLLQSGVPRERLFVCLGLNKPAIRDAIKSDLRAGIRLFYTHVSTAGVLSLSEVRDHPLMWSHYADNHRGICIGITEALLVYRGQSFGPNPVSYVIQPPKVELATLFSKDPKVFWNVNRTLLCTKSQHWEYEREWRFVVNDGDKAYRIPGKICEVIFGAKCLQTERDEIIKLCHGRFSPHFFEIQLDENSWQPAVVPLAI